MVVGLCWVALAGLGGCGDDSETSAGAGGTGGVGGGGTSGGGGAGGAAALEWTDCNGGFECASLEVPIDHDDPSLGVITLAIKRRLPEGELLGTIVILPGGPGDSGTSAVGKQGLTIQDDLPGYQIVGFDARGVGDSTPHVQCGDSAAVDAIIDGDTSPDTPAERAALDVVAADWLAACVDNTDPALLPRVDSIRVARDLELIRVALEVEQLDLVGLSYGTYPAIRYAELFPERVRAVVLDSSAGPYVDIESDFRALALGVQESAERFFAYCAAGCEGFPECFHPGETVEEVRAAFEAARADIEAMGIGRRADRAINNALGDQAYSLLSRALLGIEAGSTASLLAIYPPPPPDGNGGWNPLPLAALGAMWMADHNVPAGYSGADFDALVAEVAAAQAPQAAPTVASENPRWLLGTWDVGSDVVPPFVASEAPPMLFLAGEYDVSARPEDVQAMIDVLDNGSHLIVRAEGGHTQLYDGCMVAHAVSFILDPEAAPESTTCP